MKFRDLITILPIFLGACKSDLPRKDFDIVDRKITDLPSSRHKLLDSLSKLYPQSDYVRGLSIIESVEQDSLYQIEEISDLDTSGTFSLTALGVWANRNGDSSQAIRYFKKALNSDEHKLNKWSPYFLYLQYKEFSLDLSLKYLRQSLAIDPSFSQALIELSYNLDLYSKCDSITYLIGRIAPQFMNEEASSLYGDSFFLCGRYQESEKVYNNSLKAGKNGLAFLGLGNLNHYGFSDFTKAEKYLRMAIEYERVRCQAYSDLAWLFYDQSSLDSAKLYMRKSMKISQDVESYSEGVKMFLKLNDPNEAFKIVSKMKEEFPDSFAVEGFDLIIKFLQGKYSDSEFNLLLKGFTKRHGTESVKWLTEYLDDSHLNKLKLISTSPIS